MAINIQAVNANFTKMASGTVQCVFLNPNGSIRFCCVIPAADFTSFNTTVNGGAAGANLVKSYSQDQNNGDYPTEYVCGV